MWICRAYNEKADEVMFNQTCGSKLVTDIEECIRHCEEYETYQRIWLRCTASEIITYQLSLHILENGFVPVCYKEHEYY
jgi:hypothetical protein